MIHVDTHRTGDLPCTELSSTGGNTVYLAGIAKKDKRGSIVVIQQLAIEFGILVMYFVGYGCLFISHAHFSASFRTV